MIRIRKGREDVKGMDIGGGMVCECECVLRRDVSWKRLEFATSMRYFIRTHKCAAAKSTAYLLQPGAC